MPLKRGKSKLKRKKKYVPEMTSKNLQDFAVVNVNDYVKFMSGRKRDK